MAALVTTTKAAPAGRLTGETRVMGEHMGFGFNVKLAPGVRVRASSEGFRTRVGPRAARVHVGGGRTAISSGAGPLIWSGSVGGKRRRGTLERRATTPPGSASAAAELTAGAVAVATRKLEEVQAKYGAAEIDAYWRTIGRLLIALVASVIVTGLFAPAVLITLVWMIVAAVREIRRRRVIDRVTRSAR
jgi:hypothetical protein